ncbi:fungal hydrophobin-domain-containing protein [Ephemerocybe angulata]|uniref:Hydrophobin n=1 Tax=Ephemerocybe angulata TaxID=980116 RepID=A0A8H6LX48_9AGAR|nr:fungal hydrophobin-domain-containing protein [Tulosesus angulatus]
MRATVVFAFFAFVFAFVGAIPSRGLNARRLAQGLGPLPPVRRAPTPVAIAPRQQPSSTPQCGSGPVQCCKSVGKSNDSAISLLLGLLGISPPSATETVGVGCSPVGLLGIGGNSCSSQPVCCSNNSFNGLVAIGCVPININL